VCPPLLEQINSGSLFVGDGAMGTMLFAHGLQTGDCPEKWNLDHPKTLEEIARLYHQAGADIVSTNTFGGSALKLKQYGLGDRTEEINAAAVCAVRNAIGDEAYLSVSCGPCGQLIEPLGDVSEDAVFDSFLRQLRGATQTPVDLICVETMTDLSETKLAAKAAQTAAPGVPVAVTMTFDETPNGFYTMMGVSIVQAAQELSDAGVDIIGSNCGNGIENMIKIAHEFKACSSLPIMIQSNAGLPVLNGDRLTYPETPEFMADQCRELVELGVSIIGGCCGTTPEHIRAIRAMVDGRGVD